MGFIGEHGRGVAEVQGVMDDVDFIIGTFSKSVGTVGGFCVSNHPKFEILRLVCRPYVFTASLPPSVVATAATSIRKLMHGNNKRAHLWENSKRLHAGLKALGFTLGTEEPQYEVSEDRAVLAPGFRVLDERERKILHLRFFEGLTQSQIAQQVGISQMHVSRLIRRSLEKIREEIAADEFDEVERRAAGGS